MVFTKVFLIEKCQEYLARDCMIEDLQRPQASYCLIADQGHLFKTSSQEH